MRPGAVLFLVSLLVACRPQSPTSPGEPEKDVVVIAPNIPELSAPPSNGINSPNARVTWTKLTSRVALCPEITRQVGATSDEWLEILGDGNTVRLQFWAEGPPRSSPLQDSPGVFTGTRTGDSISAANRVGGALSCNAGMILAKTDGKLVATISGNRIAGEYTEEFGANSLVVATFQFVATVGP